MSLATTDLKSVEMSGTSMSAPLVTGAAALYLSQHRTASPQMVLDAIRNAADPNVENAPSGTTNLKLDVSTF